MPALKGELSQLSDRINAFSLRERSLVCLVTVAVILALWDVLINAGIGKEREWLAKEVDRLQKETSAQILLAQQIRAKGEIDPNDGLRKQLVSVNSEFNKVKAQIDLKAGDLITPQQMARALEELLSQHRNIVLINLETEPPEDLFTEVTAEQNPHTSSSNYEVPRVYRHGLTLEIEGSYFETLGYLKALEALDWRFYWDAVDYAVQEYPLARTKITVFTLNFDEGWLGV